MSDATDADLPHENGARKLVARRSTPSMPYQAFRTLAEARTRADALVVLDVDGEPWEPLATFPARRVEADEGALRRLHADLGAALACVMDPEVPSVEGRVRYESGGPLNRWADSLGGNGVGLRESLLGIDLEREAEAVFLGLKPAIDPDYPCRIARWRAWWEAVDRGDVDAVNDLIKRGFPVGSVCKDGHSALFAAVRAEDVAMVRILLEHGADPNQPSVYGLTPMTNAVRYEDPLGRDAAAEILRRLLAAGGRLGLREAVMLGDVDLARRLLDADPTIDVSGDAGLSFSYPYLMVAAWFGRLDMVRFLLDRGADVHGTDDDIYHTALCVAASGGYAEMAVLLMDRGADPDHVSCFGFTPLAYAAQHGHADVVRLLLERGVRRTLLDSVFMNDAAFVAEHLSAEDRDVAEVEVALELCERHFVVGGGDVGILRLLLEASSKPGRPPGWGPPDAIFRCAIEAGRIDVVAILIDYGSDPGLCDFEGKTPAQRAELAGHIELAEFLRAAVAAVAAQDEAFFGSSSREPEA